MYMYMYMYMLYMYMYMYHVLRSYMYMHLRNNRNPNFALSRLLGTSASEVRLVSWVDIVGFSIQYYSINEINQLYFTQLLPITPNFAITAVPCTLARMYPH